MKEILAQEEEEGKGEERRKENRANRNGGRCEDCGSQSEKIRECPYKMCRTHRRTHIHTTAGDPRRLHLPLPLHHHSSSHQNPIKRSRLITGADGGKVFPAAVSTTALFRCLRVRSSEEPEQLAYLTSVSIGGHLFKGILHDHGLDLPIIKSGTDIANASPSSTHLPQVNPPPAAASSSISPKALIFPHPKS